MLNAFFRLLDPCLACVEVEERPSPLIPNPPETVEAENTACAAAPTFRVLGPDLDLSGAEAARAGAGVYTGGYIPTRACCDRRARMGACSEPARLPVAVREGL